MAIVYISSKYLEETKRDTPFLTYTRKAKYKEKLLELIALFASGKDTQLQYQDLNEAFYDWAEYLEIVEHYGFSAEQKVLTSELDKAIKHFVDLYTDNTGPGEILNNTEWGKLRETAIATMQAFGYNIAGLPESFKNWDKYKG